MKLEKERGAVILESTYCILLATVILMFMLSFGFFLYQKAMVSIVTNEVAEEVSQTYKLRNVTNSASMTSDDISGIGKYRYLLFSDSFEYKNETKAYNFVDMRLSKTSLAKETGGLTVDVETKVDDIGRRHYAVTVKQKYAFLLGDLLNAVGQEGTQELKATSYVAGVDVLNYVNTVKVTKYGIDKMAGSVNVLETVDKAISLLHSIFGD